MRQWIGIVAFAAALAGGTASGAPGADEVQLGPALDAQIHPEDIGAFMKHMSAEPNNVGSPHDKANAEWQLTQFKSFGWKARIESFDIYYGTPVSETLELLGPKPFKALLKEPPIPGDTTSTSVEKGLPAYLVYQGDGDVTAPLVYVNFGMPDDYKALQRMGVEVKGKIVIVRYGQGWRGLKVKLAQEHGALGCLIYSDPRDDGYSVDTVYPDGPARPPAGIQRGSVADMTLFSGDPLTPNVGATAKAKRLEPSESPILMKIPALPISYADAQPLLESLDGQTVPAAWRGGLPITYRTGPSRALVHLAVKSDWGLKTIYDVIATLPGSVWPDQWIVRGNHHDGWVYGASDPLSGQSALMAEAKALGALYTKGWRPKRTLVYASWDAEEPMTVGSVEWAEAHAAELQKKAVIYVNSDTNGRGLLNLSGSHDFERLATQIATEVTDPETGVTVDARRRAYLRVAASEGQGGPDAKAAAARAADPQKDLEIGAPGAGSDFAVFVHHLGVPTVEFGYGSEGSSAGVYHSAYDTFEFHSRFVDPGFVYDALLAKTVGRLVIRLADADLPQQQAGDFADAVSGYLDEIRRLETNKRAEAETQAALLTSGAYRLAADPSKSSGPPEPLPAVPRTNFTPLADAIAHLKRSAAAYDAAIAAHGAGLDPGRLKTLQGLMLTIDQTLAIDEGLPGRPWYRNLVYAAGRYTGYGAKTLPGVREAIEEGRWADADHYVGLTAGVLNAYADRLDQATKLLTGG
jgi:N-acetylated-alpha-linked acidic dipeptidase